MSRNKLGQHHEHEEMKLVGKIHAPGGWVNEDWQYKATPRQLSMEC